MSKYGRRPGGFQLKIMEGDSGLDVLSNGGALDIIPPSEYDPFEVHKLQFILKNVYM